MDERRVYRRKGERYQDVCVERKDAYDSGSVIILGGISYNRRTDPVIVNGNLNALRYRDEIFRRHVRPFIRANGGIFQHDNARPHVAHVCMEYLHRRHIDVLPWPALSPDMSPIEHLWDMLDRRIRQRRHQPETLGELREAILVEWRNIPHRAIQRLIGSMRRRCRALLDARGGYTRY